ncbi:MAG: pseudouridine synthase [Bacillota bacterium]
MKSPNGPILFEDEDLLAVAKPPGLNTHSPDTYSGEGLYEWLRDREPRWSDLSIVHRLDKETSGVIVFAKSSAARRSLTQQFAAHTVGKVYRLLTDRPVSFETMTIESSIVRAGVRYVATPWTGSGPEGERAVTRFTVCERPRPGMTVIKAEPETGRPHQIRAQAAAAGFPVLGDRLYGGTAAARVCLHAEELRLVHPTSGDERVFRAPADLTADPRLALRGGVIDETETDAHRLIHGAADGFPGWHVDRLGDYLLSQAEEELDSARLEVLESYLATLSLRGAYHRFLRRDVRAAAPTEASPRHLLGDEAPEEVIVRENGLRFALSFREGYSVGLFLDQRDNRRRFLVDHVSAGFPPITGPGAIRGEVLNTFAYTCGFSVCAAKAGLRVTSLDLSRKYLDWGRRNMILNGLDPAGHDFIYGDAFDWIRRLARKGRVFSAIVLDPPTFSSSKRSGVFRAEKDYGRLVGDVLPLLAPDGILLASTNAARLRPEDFVATVEGAVTAAGRRVTASRYAPQPPDFPVTRDEPAHLKTLWLKVE